jgi:elongator complex protein 4
MQWDLVDGEEDQDDYESLINKVRKVVLDSNFSSAIPVAPGTPRHALRVAIHSLASPSWQSKSPYVSLCKKTLKKNYAKCLLMVGFI